MLQPSGSGWTASRRPHLESERAREPWQATTAVLREIGGEKDLAQKTRRMANICREKGVPEFEREEAT